MLTQGSIFHNRYGVLYQVVRRPLGHQTIYTWMGTRVDGPSSYEYFAPDGTQVDRSSPWLDLAKKPDPFDPALLVSVGDSVCLVDHPYADQLRATCIVSAARADATHGTVYQLEHWFKDDGYQRVSPNRWLPRTEFLLVSKATKESLQQLQKKVFAIPTMEVT